MRPQDHILDSQQVHRAAAEHLQTHLQFQDYKRKTSAPVLWSLLLAAAARITSLSDACQRLRDAPSDETARKALLATLPRLSERCHDDAGRQLFEALVDQSYVAESDRADAVAASFQAAVLTDRRRVWALVRRTGAEGLSRPCATCRVPFENSRDVQRVLGLCLDAACALLVADAMPDASTDLLLNPVSVLVPRQRRPDRSI